MRTKPFYKLILLSLSVAVLMSACKEQDYSVESIVYEDGAIDRKVIISRADSIDLFNNLFGVYQTNGWVAEIDTVFKDVREDTLMEEDSTQVIHRDSTREVNITFTKHFNSAEELNEEMDDGNAQSDTLFRIRSTFTKKFGWFFTYIDYSDTYIAVNRFHEAPVNDYFTEEDYAFINRLPAHKTPLSKADNNFYKRLSEYISKDYFNFALAKEYWNIMAASMREHHLDSSMVDSFLLAGKVLDSLGIGSLIEEENVNDSIVPKLLEEMNFHLPIPAEVIETYYSMTDEVKPRRGFMSDVYAAEYFSHKITMPWKVVRSNADSISDRQLFWTPPVMKFLITDYAMTARSRKLNLWAVLVTAFVVIAGLWWLFRKRSS